MELDNLELNIKDYLYLAEFGENKKHNTIKSMKKDLSQLLEYLRDVEEVTHSKEITNVMMRSFLIYLQENQISKRSLNRKLSSLRSFFKYLLKEKIIYQSPVELIASPDFNAQKPDIISLEEINKLRDVITLKNANGIRDRLMLELLYSSGITSTEMLSLSETAFDLDKRELYIMNGKNKRVVFFSAKVRYLVNRYIEAKKEKYKDKYDSDIMFVNGSAKRLSDRSLRRIIDRYSAKAGLDREISPYTFRHTFAVHMLKHGMDILYLKELMGHSTIDSTRVYENMVNDPTVKI